MLSLLLIEKYAKIVSSSDLTTDNSWPDSDVIAPILRASTTLAFPRFRDFCIHMLRRTWSDDLNFYTTYGIPFPAETIVLAKQYHVPDVLKRSYYELIRENLLDEKSGSYATLSSEDLFLVIKTRNELSEEWMSLVAVPASFACPRKNNDSEKSVCPSLASRKAAWYKIVHESGLAQEWASDPIAGLDKLIAADWKAHRFCDECTERRQAEWREKKEELWEKLDEWLQLKEARAEVSTLLKATDTVAYLVLSLSHSHYHELVIHGTAFDGSISISIV